MTAGYSGTPLPKKLGIKEGSRVVLLRAPEGFMSTLGKLPEGAVVRGKAVAPADVVVYAYHTNAEGIYPKLAAPDGSAIRHGQLRGWAKTGANGRYAFDTIRPAAYPGHTIPQHVHMQILEPGIANAYYLDDLLFSDDAFVTAEVRAQLRGRGGPGIATPTKDANGTWQVRRDIVLGRNIPNYPER